MKNLTVKRKMSNFKIDKYRRYSIDPLAYYIHQDNCVWRCIGWMIPIEAAIITGAFTHPGFPGLFISTLGIILSFSFYMYAKKACEDRDVNLAIIDSIKPIGFRLTAEAPWYKKELFWLRIEFFVIIASNVFLFVLALCKWQGWCNNVISKMGV